MDFLIRQYPVMVAALVTLTGLAPDLHAGGAPANDTCVNATVISGSTSAFQPAPYDTTGATTSTCDPLESCGHPSGQTNSVWYSYTPQCSGTINIDTLGSNYDTVVSIYDDCKTPPCLLLATELACNDDIFGGVQSGLFNVNVVGKTTYYIRIADYGPGTGGGLLNFDLAFVPGDNKKGKISRNIYRIPYANGEDVATTNYVTHCGGMDTVGQAGSPPIIVAAASGRVCEVIEHFDDCGSSGLFGPFGNKVQILHANGELSGYLHLKQWSPSSFGITPGMWVTQGQPIGIEGEVGRTSGSTTSPRAGTCLETIPDGAGDCGRHLHWGITRYTTGEVVNPLTCGIADNLYETGPQYTAGTCTGQGYSSSETLSNATFSGYGTFEVVQATNSITASTVTVANLASVVLHAGNSVRLLPGFRANEHSYFRAEIGAPDTTAASSWPAPSSCPCTGAVAFCYQWTDLQAPDRVAQGCPTYGPDPGKCVSCDSGTYRCCPCDQNDTCDP